MCSMLERSRRNCVHSELNLNLFIWRCAFNGIVTQGPVQKLREGWHVSVVELSHRKSPQYRWNESKLL